MNRSLSILIFFILFAFSQFSLGQTPKQSPTPQIDDDDDVVKITTSLIQMDVIVTDKKGNQITNLKPEDFEVYENDEKQEITNLSYISAKPDNPIANKSNSNDRIDIPIPTKELSPDQVRRTYALVVDDLGLSFSNIYWTKKSLQNFVKEQMQEGDLVAIIRTGGGIGAVQSFTSDKNQLLATIKKLKWNPQGRVGISSFEPLKLSDKEGVVGTGGSRSTPLGNSEDKSFQEEIANIRRDNFSIGSLGSLNYIIKGMKDMPGRKSIMFFSEGFVLLQRNQSGKFNSFSSNKVLEAMRVLADAANRASVAIYTFDPRGLEIPDLILAADEISRSGGGTSEPQRQFNESIQSLRYLSDETGGLAYVNQNDLNYGLRKAIDDQSYYLIGYEPDSETFDPKKNRFNNLKIKVNIPGANVRYRSGFFAIADNKRETTIARSPEEKVREALLSPFAANDIDLRLYTISGNDSSNGDFLRSLINISAKDLKFITDSDGNRKANFDIVAYTFGVDGKPIDEVAKNFTIRVDDKTYQTILLRGFVYDLPVKLKKSGAYQFRIALRDTNSGKVGSASKFIEVPKFKKDRLQISNLMLQSSALSELQNVSTSSENERLNRALTDTTLREFAAPVILRYGAVIYNATNSGNNPPKLSMQTRLISNGKIILEGKPEPVPTDGQNDLKRIDLVGAFKIGTGLPAGDYIFQIIITDELAKDKNQIDTQWIDFEIIE